MKEYKADENPETNSSNEKWQEQEAKLKNEETVAESGRIFIRNLPYVVSEDDIKELFEKFGKPTTFAVFLFSVLNYNRLIKLISRAIIRNCIAD